MSAEKTIFLGTGRRKTSTARVRLTEGTGKLTANGSDFETYFSHENFAKQAYRPLLTVEDWPETTGTPHDAQRALLPSRIEWEEDALNAYGEVSRTSSSSRAWLRSR